MIVKKLHEVPLADTTGYENVTKQVVIGPDDGSGEIVLRYFTLEPGGASPYHSHDFPHLVKVERGSGMHQDKDKKQTPIQAGDFVFVPENEVHNFVNVGAEPFEFICIVPGRGEG